MRKFALIAAASTLAVAAMPMQAEAKGCIRGAIAGAVAGHYAGHHAVAGAMGGCVVAHTYYKHKATQAAQAKAHPAPVAH